MSARASTSRLGLLARLDDGAIMRFAFFALLAGTFGMIYVDYREMSALDGLVNPPVLQPILPPASPTDGGSSWHPAVSSPPERLDSPLEIILENGGVLRLTGSFDPGSAERFDTEISSRGDYVETVVLDSPGGSVVDAIAIGSAIRARGYATEVEPGGLCASSCPLAFAGGTERVASANAAIGVHQIYAAAMSGDPAALAQAAGLAMSEAQRTTALITRHLTENGVDPALWLHALETSPDRLYYFSPEEVIGYRLATSAKQ